MLIHQALPGVSYSEVDLSTEFLGYILKAPLVIEGMTGGYQQAGSINEKLAKLANEFGIAIGVGSQRPVLLSNFERAVVDTYRVVRENAPDVPVIGNVGVTELRSLNTELVRKLVESIEADALAIHLNPAQELIQPEGNKNFKFDLIRKVEEIVRDLGIPVIIKEVGNGLSIEVVKKFHEIGVRIFDVAGSCGTDWIKIEAYRNDQNSLMRRVGLALSESNWGIPTPLSLIEARFASPEATIIASGGIWNGIYAAKVIALGADLVGFARPILKALLESGYEGAKKYLETYLSELRSVVYLTGAARVKDLRYRPLVLGPRIVNYLVMRNIDVSEYLGKIRQGAVL